MKKEEMDLQFSDSENDKKHLLPEEATFDLPEVKDIPGQEFVHPPNLKEMAETTIASAGEEGMGIFGDDDEPYSSERLEKGDKTETYKELRMGYTDLDDAKAGDNDPDLDDEESNVSDEEREALERSESMDTPDNDDIRRARVDDRDEDGDELNEETTQNGKDLDIPGEELDDDNEEIGEEDEENNAYSLPDDQ